MQPAAPDQGSLTPVRDVQRFSRSFAAGDVIFEIGSPGRCLFVVTLGEVEIRMPRGALGEVVVNTLRVGETFGEIALLEDGARTASAIATRTPTVLVEIDKARFVYLVGQQPAFALTVMRGLARRMEGRAR